jgi:ribonuclease E
MVVIDVNTGRFTGKGGNLEETVTKNNLEAAEEIVRQLRLRDLGGIIVIDFIDMVLESNRDLVLRRLLECLGRDRTKHQVAEVSSLGLVQMTRKRVGTGLLEAFSHQCEHCKGRGVIVSLDFDTPAAAEPEPEQRPQSSRPRALVPPGAAPSPALLAPGSVRGGANGAGANGAGAAGAGANGSQQLVEAVPDAAGSPVAAEDPVEPSAAAEAPAGRADVAGVGTDSGGDLPAPSPNGSGEVAPEATVLAGPDPVVDVVDDGRPQRRRRRATRP